MATKRQQNGGSLQPVYAIVGKDRFLRTDALEAIIQRTTAEDADFNVSRFDGDAARLSEVLDDVRTLSLLGGRRVVVVDDADGFITAHRGVLEKYCASPADTGSLVLLCQSMPKNTRLYKAISANGEIVAVEAPRGRGVRAWIVARARKQHGVTMVESAAQRLQDQLGDSPGILDAELAKLATFVGDRKQISLADIDTLTGHHREEKVFAVTDALAVGDTSSALHRWEQVLATDRAAPGRAIAGLAWGIRKLLDARRQWDSGADLATLARSLFTDVATAKRRLGQVSTVQLESQLEDLLAADIAIKTGGSTVDVAVEKFIVKHGSGARLSA